MSLSRSPRRVLLVGDTHGDADWWFQAVFPAAARCRASVILQVGDFGVQGGRIGGRYLDSLQRELDRTGRWLWFIDGNHDDMEVLYGLPVGEDGTRQMRSRILHLPRGVRWTWADRRFLACGGAGSIDRQWRTRGHDWWPEEQITAEDVERCIGRGPTDVLVSHDAPLEAPVVGLDLRGVVRPDVLEAAAASRRRLAAVVAAVRPRLAIWGHWHEHHLCEVQSLTDPERCFGLLGLSENGSPWGNLAILEPGKLAGNGIAAITVVG
jgi:hypothetical protein